ncbi:caspase family protein [Bradyrhizobium japonicum]|uniref:caspase family protein n=1 Tax=Bradyrhizobium japonicum TaxID=375 RepID=UPI001BAC0F04|nr:caspase family protein [Bradyrhizobium japonicum]
MVMGRILLAAFLLAMPLVPSQAAGDRYALVIGNARYPDADAPLKNPVNDARDVAEELKRGGFTVEVGENLTRDGMRGAIDRFYGKIKPGSVALLFFSGYGVQSARQSYLIPVDAKIWTESDVRRDGFSLEVVLNELNGRGAGVKIALIDASRSNPFERRFRSYSGGLAPVIAPNGSLVAYSAALASVAPEVAGERGRFVQEFLKEMRVPGLSGEETLNRTKIAVTRASRSEQIPWISSTLTDNFAFVPGAGGSRLTATAAVSEAVTSPPSVPAPVPPPGGLLLAPAQAPHSAPAPVAESHAPDRPASATSTPTPSSTPNLPPPAEFGRRVALVIGNSTYNSAAVLPNPSRDATAVAEALQRLGFQSVVLETNLGREKMVDALRTFARQAQSADWAVVYFAGHGMEVGGINYLVPVDANIESDLDMPFAAVPLEQVLNATERARKLRLVILDACRNNPFANKMTRTASVSSRGVVDRGFARIEPDAGTLVVYAAKDGQTASDGDGANSPFTTALLKNLARPGVEVRRLFDNVRDDVRDLTRQRQLPYSYGSLSGREDFYFLR